ncbi:MAG: 50S ribosomal protein L9 [Phycisphaerales bacterium]
MPKNIELLLTETVDNLGIVGDVVHVKAGYARNFLLPRAMAVEPTDAAKKALADRRAAEQQRLAALRKEMEQVCEKLEGYEITLERSCNDNGWLYGSVTQNDIMEALHEEGFELVQERHIRIGAAIKRVDSYELPIQFDQDLKTEIKLWVVPDREIPALRTDEEEPTGETGEEPVEDSTEAGSDESIEKDETAIAE